MKTKPKEKTKKATNHPTQRHWHEMNRKQRREMMRKIQSEDLSLEVVHPHAAGIDIGNESHYVAVPPSLDNQAVRRCTPTDFCEIRFGHRRRFGRCGPTGDNAMTWYRQRRVTSSGCRRR